MSEPLSVGSILAGMAEALPTHPTGDDSSDLASSYEAIALLIHAYLAALGFKLCGFDEDKKLRKLSFQPVKPSSNTRVQLNASPSPLGSRHNGTRALAP